MKKFLPVVLLLLLVPSIGWSQMNVLRVSSVDGKVEIRPGASKTFDALTNKDRQVQVGDVIRTGPGSTVVLTLPDESYMVVQPNTEIVIKDFWSQGSVRTVVNQLLGRVRFYINHVGGRPNPYRVDTPTALIAVRGTTFDVDVDASGYTEVTCLDGQVGVENVALGGDREVILDPGWHTGVAAGQNPLKPALKDEDLNPTRTLKVVKKGTQEERNIDQRLFEQIMRDNDKSNRAADRGKAPTSGTDTNVGRAKPTMTFPE